MEAKGRIVNYVVRYNSDPRLFTDNHKSDLLFLVDTDERGFDDLAMAVLFLSECVSPITCIEEIIPELKNAINFKYVLPERNIKPKHVLSNRTDEFTEFDTDDVWK
jgi:hypothetical protein